MQDYITLNTGAKMPLLGLGTWKAEPNKVGDAVKYALTEAGYKHIDCAAIYLNEKEIGQTFKKVFSGGKVKREDVFITSKLWNTEHSTEDVIDACKQTLSDLQLDYLDLYLIHWGVAILPEDVPSPRNARGEPLDENGVLRTKQVPLHETWTAMQELVKMGLVRAVGVSNFTGALLNDFLAYGGTVPAMNQIELHPYNQQTRLIEFCKYRGIAVTAYSPLGSPGNLQMLGVNHPILLEDAAVKEIAAEHKKSPAQVLIRWSIEREVVVIPKSVTPQNIKANGEVFDFVLTQENMESFAKLERRYRFLDPWTWWKIPYFE